LQFDRAGQALGILAHAGRAPRDGHVHGKEHRTRQRQKETLLPQLTPPGIYPLPRHIVPLRNLRYRRPVNANRHDDVELLLITPAPSPFLTKNLHTHRKPHLRHVANDVVKHVS
jgi:hypothetical protein